MKRDFFKEVRKNISPDDFYVRQKQINFSERGSKTFTITY